MKKRADGLYQVNRTCPDGKRRSFYGKTKREAEGKFNEFCAENVITLTEVKNAVCVNSAADLWAAEHFPTLRHGSLRAYKPALARIKERLGEIPVAELSAEDCAQLLQGMKRDGFGTKTISNTHGVLNMICEFICIHYGIKSNPSKLVSTPSAGRTVRKPPSENEQERYKNAIEMLYDTDGGLMAAFFLYTGMRRGEVLALRWRDIQQDRIMVHASVEHINNRPVIGEVKTEAGVRAVPILPQLLKILSSYKQKKRDAFVVGGGAEPLTQRQFTCRWEAFCKAAGLCTVRTRKKKRGEKTINESVYTPSVTPHQLRHLYATNLYRAGVPMEVAVRMMGHADSSMIRRIYLDVNDQMLEDAAGKLLEFYA